MASGRTRHILYIGLPRLILHFFSDVARIGRYSTVAKIRAIGKFTALSYVVSRCDSCVDGVLHGVHVVRFRPGVCRRNVATWNRTRTVG